MRELPGPTSIRNESGERVCVASHKVGYQTRAIEPNGTKSLYEIAQDETGWRYWKKLIPDETRRN